MMSDCLRKPLGVHFVRTPQGDKYIHQSPFYTAERMIDAKYPTSISSDATVNKNPISALPRYNILKILTNHSVSSSPVKKSQTNDAVINFCVDGSCNPNPGTGSYVWFSIHCQTTLFLISTCTNAQCPLTTVK